LEEHPIADHVLDVVRHHRQHRGNEKTTEVAVLQGSESDFLSGDR
jgi:hypothetical protein